MKNSKCFALLVVMSLLILSACNSRLVYDRYASTPISGWEKMIRCRSTYVLLTVRTHTICGLDCEPAKPIRSLPSH